ncbi:hypothetical protein AeMF1_003352 [Aphanomyces euteiches]|nr:hypothetical protein AeMF1_003352 [Aphanomyces euteiches]KAH9189479.1 hypothetical protein AeNC1_008539 [Aphanomyces euteiches]
MEDLSKPEVDEPCDRDVNGEISPKKQNDEGNDVEDEGQGKSDETIDEHTTLMDEVKIYAKDVVYETRGPLYLDLCSRTPPHLGALVKSFRKTADGGMGEAEKSGLVHIGDMLLYLNEVDCTLLPFSQIIQEAKNASFPLVMRVLPKVYVPEYFPITISPPPSRSSESEASSANPWGKFGQMLDMRTKRSSFTETIKPQLTTNSPPTTSPSSSSTASAGWAQTPPAPNIQSGGASDNFQQKFKCWQDSINLDKVVGSNFLKIMGKKSADDKNDDWIQWLDQAVITHTENTKYHTSSLQLVSTGKPMGVDDGEVNCQWYRVLSDSQWILLRGATHRTYQPSIDDIGAKIAVACRLSKHDVKSKVKLVELADPIVAGPFVLNDISSQSIVDPSVQETISMMVQAGSASFSATLASSDLESFQLRVSKSHLVVVQISEDDMTTVVDKQYDRDLQVYLDPEDSVRFVLRFQAEGDLVGVTGTTNPIRQNNLSTLHLHAQSASTRDMIASTIRKFRAERLSKEDEAVAQIAELKQAGEVIEKTTWEPLLDLDLLNDSPMCRLLKEKPVEGVSKTQVSSDEVTELKRQLASQAMILKATQNERNLLAVAVDVRDRKLEEQLAANKTLLAQVEALRGELKLARFAAERSKKMEDQVKDLEKQLKLAQETNRTLEDRVKLLETDENHVKAKMDALDAECRAARSDLTLQQAQYMTLLEERNNLKAKTTDLSKELRRLLKNGQSIGDIETQLKERTQLQIDLALAKADVKRYEDEMNEFKDALNCHVQQRGMGDVEMQRVLSQNKELQRLVTHFSSSLSASQDEVAKWKQLHHNSPLKAHIKTQRQLQTSTSFKANQQVVFDEDDEEEEEDTEDET